MNQYALIRTALMALTLMLSWSSVAAPELSGQNGNKQDSQRLTSSDCREMRQERQELLDQYGSEEGSSDYEEAKKSMGVATRERFESLQAKLKRCR